MFRDLRPYPEYRLSGPPWGAALPDHWQVTRGKALFTRLVRPVRESDGVVTCFRDGVVTLRSLRRTTGFTEALQEIGYQGVRAGDLVIHAMDAFAGAVGVSDSDGKCSPVYAICRARGESEPRYYAALVREMARSQWIMALSRGVRERSTDFRFESFASELLPAPPSEEQAAIVKYLAHAHHRIDRAIAAKRKLIALLEEQKQAIINQAVTRGLDPTVPFVDTGIPWLGAIPAHWSVKSIGAVSSLVQTGPFGSQLHAEDYVSGGVPVINPSHITGSGIHADRDISVAERTANRLSRHRFKVGDVVIARRGELGRCAVVSADEAGWLCGTGSLIVRPDPEVDSRYLQVRVSSAATRAELDARSTGATMPNLNAQMISSLRIPVPPVSEQQRIVDILEREESAWRQTNRVIEPEIALLREFRTRLTSDVVTGQLDVRHIAATLSDADPGEFDRDASAMGDDLVDEVAEFLEDVDA